MKQYRKEPQGEIKNNLAILRTALKEVERKTKKILKYYVKYVKINIVIFLTKKVLFQILEYNIPRCYKEENKMASRRKEKQDMLRNYEKEQEEKRIQEELQRQEEEQAERLAYDLELHYQLEKEQKERERRRQMITEAYNRDFEVCW